VKIVLRKVDFQEIVSSDTVQFMKKVIHDKPNVDILLKKMDQEIFADFRENLDLKFTTDP
jgi:hypothetical protein